MDILHKHHLENQTYFYIPIKYQLPGFIIFFLLLVSKTQAVKAINVLPFKPRENCAIESTRKNKSTLLCRLDSVSRLWARISMTWNTTQKNNPPPKKGQLSSIDRFLDLKEFLRLSFYYPFEADQCQAYPHLSTIVQKLFLSTIILGSLMKWTIRFL